MSPRASGVDEAGRPIVAELGRAETPQETADRKAAASAKRRGSQTALNLAIATVISAVGAVVLVWALGLFDTGSHVERVDYAAETASAQSYFGASLVSPELPTGWWANRAAVDRSSDVESWQVGFVTPGEQYIALIQTREANPSWLDDQVGGAKAGDAVTIDGVTWTSYDRRGVADPGNIAYALVTTSGVSTIVLAGTADQKEFEVLATAVAKGIG